MWVGFGIECVVVVESDEGVDDEREQLRGKGRVFIDEGRRAVSRSCGTSLELQEDSERSRTLPRTYTREETIKIMELKLLTSRGHQ